MKKIKNVFNGVSSVTFNKALAELLFKDAIFLLKITIGVSSIALCKNLFFNSLICETDISIESFSGDNSKKFKSLTYFLV